MIEGVGLGTVRGGGGFVGARGVIHVVGAVAVVLEPIVDFENGKSNCFC